MFITIDTERKEIYGELREGYTFSSKILDANSNLGIDGRRIVKLNIKKGNVTVLDFYCGNWNQQATNSEDQEAYRRIKQSLEEQPTWEELNVYYEFKRSLRR